MAKQNYDYDEDIFTLREDETGKRRGHILQYVLVGLLAVLVISAALYFTIWLTNRELEYRNTIVAEDSGEIEQNAVDDTDFWPEEQFPRVPRLASTKYNTRLFAERAEIYVPMAAASGFEAYADQLAQGGAQIYVQTARLTVLNYRGTEIHLITGNNNMVELCAESRIDWNELNYAQFPLPQKGVLVEVSEGTGEGSRVLTYRQASASDAAAYCAELVSAGWTISGTLEPQDQIFACAFKKGDMQIVVDYFSGFNKYVVRLDFVNT